MSRRSGMTLIEVMAAVVSLAVVVSAAASAMFFSATKSSFANQRSIVLSQLVTEIETRRGQVVAGTAPTSATGQIVNLPGVRGSVKIDTVVTPTLNNTYSVVTTATWGDGTVTSLTDEIGAWLPTAGLGSIVSGLTSGLTGTTGLTGLTGLTGGSSGSGGSGGTGGGGGVSTIIASSDSDYGDQGEANWTYGALSGSSATGASPGSWRQAIRFKSPDHNVTGSGEDNYTIDGLSSATSISYFKQAPTLLEPSTSPGKSASSQNWIAARRWTATKTHSNASISGSVWMSNVGDASFAIYKNGSVLLYSTTFPASSSGVVRSFSASLGSLAAGDFIEIRAGAGTSDANDWLNMRVDVVADP